MKDALKVILLKTKFLYNKNTEESHDLKTAVKNTKLVRIFIQYLKYLNCLELIQSYRS